MIGLISAVAAITGAIIYWRMTRNDTLLTPDGAPTDAFREERHAETDIEIEPEQLPALTKAIKAIVVRGFGDDQAATLTERTNRLDVDGEFDLQYQIPWRNSVARLDVKVFRDDIESLIFYFKGPQTMIEALETGFKHFRSEMDGEQGAGGDGSPVDSPSRQP